MNTTSKFFMACAVVLLAAAIIMPSVQSDRGTDFNAITPAAGPSSMDFNVDANFPPVPEADKILIPARVDETLDRTDEVMQEATADDAMPTDAWGNDLMDIEPAAGGDMQDTAPKALQ